MALKVELKPGERIIIGESLIKNDNQRCRLFIEGNAPILREKDIMTPDTANTPAKRIYLAVQLMYLSNDIDKIKENYFTLVNDIIMAAPSTTPFITRISNQILSNSFYKALKETKKLIEYEKALLDNVQQSGGPSIPGSESDNSKSQGT